MLDVPGWPGHLAGQHVDVRLTAEDGYYAQRSYSIASAPESRLLELTVQRVADGEVSPYLIETSRPATSSSCVVRSAAGSSGAGAGRSRCCWSAGGSGIVPLMAMIRAHGAAKSGAVPAGLFGARAGRRDLSRPSCPNGPVSSPLTVHYQYTRSARPGARPGRIDAATIAKLAPPPAARPAIFVCGPSGFVEAATSLLVDAGHPAATIKTERFGPTGI